jgi:hypothetical protein
MSESTSSRGGSPTAAERPSSCGRLGAAAVGVLLILPVFLGLKYVEYRVMDNKSVEAVFASRLNNPSFWYIAATGGAGVAVWLAARWTRRSIGFGRNGSHRIAHWAWFVALGLTYSMLMYFRGETLFYWRQGHGTPATSDFKWVKTWVQVPEGLLVLWVIYVGTCFLESGLDLVDGLRARLTSPQAENQSEKDLEDVCVAARLLRTAGVSPLISVGFAFPLYKLVTQFAPWFKGEWLDPLPTKTLAYIVFQTVPFLYLAAKAKEQVGNVFEFGRKTIFALDFLAALTMTFGAATFLNLGYASARFRPDWKQRRYCCGTLNPLEWVLVRAERRRFWFSAMLNVVLLTAAYALIRIKYPALIPKPSALFHSAADMLRRFFL